MQCEAIYEPGLAPTHHWMDIEEFDFIHPELRTIADKIQELSEKPWNFKVNKNIYVVSDRVWKQLKKK